MADAKLREMYDTVDDQVASIDDNTSQLDIQIIELNKKIDAIRIGLMDVIANVDMTNALDVYIPTGGYIIFGINYNILNVTDWIVYDSTGIPVYEWYSIGWDNNPTIIDLESKWQFGLDNINHPIGITGTYGLQPMVDQLENAKGLLVANREKLLSSKSVFEDYK